MVLRISVINRLPTYGAINVCRVNLRLLRAPKNTGRNYGAFAST
jgi:hypothetical protein